MSRVALALALLVGALLAATPASARWTAGGTGTGIAQTADMPTGATPTVAVTNRSVTVTWAQNAFVGSTVGARGGGYTVARYAEGSTTPVAPGAGCAGTRTGTANPMTCTETNVPYGRWNYRITPVLDSFVGTEGPASAVAVVVLAAPSLTSVTAQNPAATAANGPIALAWTTVPGATGYYVFRRAPGGSYNLNAPLNGGTALTATTYSDTTAADGATYQYVVYAADSGTTPLTASVASNERSAKVITRPTAPATATATGTSGAVNVAWTTAATATAGYDVYRGTSTSTINFTTPVNGAAPVTGLTYRDTTTVSGASYVYAVRSVIIGADAAQVESLGQATTAGASCTAGYSAAVLASNPSDYFRFGEATGTEAANSASGASARTGIFTAATLGAAGALACDTNTSVTLNGTSSQITPTTTTAIAGPNTFSIAVWFKTTVAGGKLVGFGNQRSTAASGNYDRHVYVDTAGKLAFGVYPGSAKTVASAGTVNDGKWHMAVATLGAAGQRLYVDGALVASDAAVMAGEAYSGFWRIGYDSLSGWPNPGSGFFNGQLDEVAIFPTQLAAGTVSSLFTAGRP